MTRTAVLVMMIVAALLAVACSDDPEEDTPSASTPVASPQDLTTWRWVNITVDIEADSDISVARYIASDLEYPPDGGPVLQLLLGDSFIQLDAQNGEIISQSVSEADSELETTLSSLVVGSKPPEEQLPWPYASGAKPEKTLEQDNLRYSAPDPGSGIVLRYGCGSATPNPEAVPTAFGEIDTGCWIQIENELSRRAVDIDTGETIETFDRLAQEDKAAFDRWKQSIEIVGQ